MDLQTNYMYTYKTYGQMDLQTNYVHVQNLWLNGPSKLDVDNGRLNWPCSSSSSVSIGSGAGRGKWVWYDTRWCTN